MSDVTGRGGGSRLALLSACAASLLSSFRHKASPRRGTRSLTIANGPNDPTATLRNDRQSLSLAHRRVSRDPIPARLADAGYSSRHATRRRDDVAYLDRHHHSRSHHNAPGVAPDPPSRAGELATTVAAADLGSRPLVALRPGAGDDFERLALCIGARLAGVLALCRTAADADRRKSTARQSHRWLAPVFRMGVVDLDRRSRRCSADPPVVLPRQRHGAHAAAVRQIREAGRELN